MGQFQVLHKGEPLCHGDVAVCLEQHHRQRLSWNGVTDDEFGENIEAQLNVGECLDHANGDDPDSRDGKCEDQSPPWEMSWPAIDCSERHTDHSYEKSEIPPVRYQGILTHHLHVDIVKFTTGQSPAIVDLSSMEHTDVTENSGNGSKVEPVCKAKSCR